MPSICQDNLVPKYLMSHLQSWTVAHNSPPTECKHRWLPSAPSPQSTQQGQWPARHSSSQAMPSPSWPPPAPHPFLSRFSVHCGSTGESSSMNRQSVKRRPLSRMKTHIQDICSPNILLAFHMTQPACFPDTIVSFHLFVISSSFSMQILVKPPIKNEFNCRLLVFLPLGK